MFLGIRIIHRGKKTFYIWSSKLLMMLFFLVLVPSLSVYIFRRFVLPSVLILIANLTCAYGIQDNSFYPGADSENVSLAECLQTDLIHNSIWGTEVGKNALEYGYVCKYGGGAYAEEDVWQDSPFSHARGTVSPPEWIIRGGNSQEWERTHSEHYTYFRGERLSNLGYVSLHQCRRVLKDYKTFYTWKNSIPFIIAFSGGAILANTSLDQDFRNWYQRDVRTSGTDNFATACKVFGEGKYMIPTALGLAVLGTLWDDYTPGSVVSDYGFRVTRAYLVGAPPLLFLQALTGGARPCEDSEYSSHWRPFTENHGVSGHAFMGAVPFITAAQMSDNIFMTGIFYFLSTWTAWSRINDDAHYLSQVIMGWTLAYVSCTAVGETEKEYPGGVYVSMMPSIQPDQVGVTLAVRW